MTRKPCGGAPVFCLCLPLLFLSFTFLYGHVTLHSVFQIKFWFVLHLVSTLLVRVVIVAVTRKLCDGAPVFGLCFLLFFLCFAFFPLFWAVLCHAISFCFLTCFLPTLLLRLFCMSSHLYFLVHCHQQYISFILYIVLLVFSCANCHQIGIFTVIVPRIFFLLQG